MSCRLGQVKRRTTLSYLARSRPLCADKGTPKLAVYLGSYGFKINTFVG